MAIRKRNAVLLSILVAFVFATIFHFIKKLPDEPQQTLRSPLLYRARVKVLKPHEISIPPKRATGPAPAGWRLFHPTQHFLANTAPVAPTVSEQLPCLEQWIADGLPCNVQHVPVRLDAVWTWVNGSEPIISATRDMQVALAMEARKLSGVQPPFPGSRITHFRTHDEMINSMRSVFDSLPPDLVRKYILITADVPADDTERARFGSVPTWLDLGSDVQVLHHSEIFRVPKSVLGDMEGRLWRDQVVPSFNSLSIESQFIHIREAAPTMFYLNDDCFLMRPLSAADFESALYGPVFRIQLELSVRSRPPERPPRGVDKEGEWPGLEYTNWLLDQRFGARPRRYLHHVAKVIPTPILHEVGAIWADELAQTGAARFRGHGNQVNVMYLATWYTVEKHREALLYAFVMLRVDADADGWIDADERETLLAGLSDSGEVLLPGRRMDGEAVKRNLVLAGLVPPKETEYTWLAADGYPLVQSVEHRGTHCVIDVRRCLAPGTGTALEVFRRVAFEMPECGDCLIAHVVGLSGDAGLGGFLPSKERVDAVGMQLEYAKRWEDTQFPSGLGRRAATRMIQRYSYVLGKSPIEFLAIKRSGDIKKLANITKNSTAFFALNDDLYNPTQIDQLDAALETWFEERWGDVRPWWEKK
ncbi:hypothetical protein HMN09_00490200 [Mycena chlorophos]|uniref:Stealth protein CR3 conserved region 3 domain-containing protein n=1 Tax=Mycena chlorophos TaxID=658473 RepID=A0A8H6TAU8_MYCCL|nr:hypothetical protein HMN09_00490200 [Mycena chlorophos]